MRSVDDDRTAAARIRDAAITEFATNGVAATSVRKIAATAGVSPGLVMHHFGSKDELRVACDEYVAATIRRLKTDAMTAFSAFGPMAAIQTEAGGAPLAKYLARTLVDGSPHVAELVDELVNDAMDYIQTAVDAGVIEPSAHPRQRAAILTMWSLGGFVLHEHLIRLIGVDITDRLDTPAALADYVRPALDILTGFFTDESSRRIRGSLFDAPDSVPQEIPT